MAAEADLEPVLWKVWNAASLQRCHLIPAALGGEDSPQNLVLLCARCHSEAPDVADREYMLRWIEAHESWGNLLATALRASLDQMQVTERELEAFNELGGESVLALTRSIMSEWAVPVAGRFSYATLAACAVEAVRRALPDTREN